MDGVTKMNADLRRAYRLAPPKLRQAVAPLESASLRRKLLPQVMAGERLRQWYRWGSHAQGRTYKAAVIDRCLSILAVGREVGTCRQLPG